MITFTFLSGKQIEFNISKQYKGFYCEYFYHIKAYVLDETQYCYCTLIYNTKKIKDIDKIINYDTKEINVTIKNIYNYKLRNWIDIDKLDWSKLSLNPNAIQLLEKNKEKIHWDYLSKNPNAIYLLEENKEKIKWYYYLSANPNTIYLLEKNKEKIN